MLGFLDVTSSETPLREGLALNFHLFCPAMSINQPVPKYMLSAQLPLMPFLVQVQKVNMNQLGDDHVSFTVLDLVLRS